MADNDRLAAALAYQGATAAPPTMAQQLAKVPSRLIGALKALGTGSSYGSAEPVNAVNDLARTRFWRGSVFGVPEDVQERNQARSMEAAWFAAPIKRAFGAPQDEALRLAQERAALPVERGGLGLPKNNTAMDRAKAMGGKDMVHFSRTGGDYATLDSGQYAIAPFDAVGTHVGTPQAAMDRFRNTTATTDQIKGTTYPVTILGDSPMMNQNGMPFGEDDLNALLRQQGGHNWSDIHGGKMTYQDMNADLRKKLFEKQGYTSIPYYNEVEGKGSISYIVPPENIRSRFAAFDPFRRNAAIAAAMGVAAPDLLAKDKK